MELKNTTSIAGRSVFVSVLFFVIACMFSSMATTAAQEETPTISLGRHNWIVLTVEDGKALILSERVLEFRMFHTIEADAAWEHSALRHYLNNEFLYNSFSDEERQRIVPAWISNERNQWFGTPGGDDTLDYVFLLSLEEVVRFFGDSGQLADRYHQDNVWWGIHDQYSPERIARNLAAVVSWWWLRSPGDYNSGPAIVSPVGRVHVAGYSILRGGAWVRPALWVEFSVN